MVVYLSQTAQDKRTLHTYNKL